MILALAVGEVAAAADMLAFGEDVNIHICDRDTKGIRVDGANEQVEHDLLFASQDILDLLNLDVVHRPVAHD